MPKRTPKQLLAKRRELEKKAHNEYDLAQKRYEQARAKDLHPREKLRQNRDRALAYFRRRHLLTLRSIEQVKEGGVSPLRPERTKLSPNRSSRNGVKPRLIVLHITVSHNRAGLGDIDGILGYFGQKSSQVSSHIVNDAEGHDARCVPDGEKSWTCGAYNSVSLNIEQIEYADKPRSRWIAENGPQLDNTARWIAAWSKKYGIPITKSTSNGVCEHRSLGAAGGGHSDCGPGYPMDYVLERARYFKSLG